MLKNIILIIMLTLGGCQHYNTFVLTSYELSNEQITNMDLSVIHKTDIKNDNRKTHVKPPELNSSLQCPKFELPSFPKEPVNPSEKLKNIEQNNYKEIDKVLMDYTQQLARYTRELKRLIQEEHFKYLKACKR